MICRNVVLGAVLYMASFVASNAQAAENIFPNIGFTGIGTGINAPLNKLHLHLDGENPGPQPILRFSYGALAPTNGQPIAQLAFCSTTPNALYYSAQAGAGDLVVRTASTAGKLILSSQNADGAILFTTTQAAAAVGVAAVDQERMRITSMGHVGILQNNPQELLHIGNKMTFHIGFTNNYIGYNVYRDGSNVDRVFVSETSPTIARPQKVGMTLDGVLELGVGRTSSGVAGNSVDWYEDPAGTSPLDAFSGLTFKEHNGKGCASFGKYWPDADSRVFIKSFSGTNACALKIVSSANAEMLRVGNDGKVGIGTTAPKALLHVNGDVVIGANRCTITITSPLTTRLSVDGAICTKEIWVKSGTPWADYVFADEYVLPPLSEIDTFIGANKRLPGVPSAAEVEENGVSLGDMQVVLLKKVEELTLYVIDLNKRNDLLQKDIQELRTASSSNK